MKIFAERLKLLRKEKHQTQAEIAEFLGITSRTYQYYESAAHDPDIFRLIKLADYFDVTLDYLLGRSEER